MKKIRTVFISTGQQEPRGRGKHKQEGGESIKMNKESVKELIKAKRAVWNGILEGTKDFK